MKPELIFLLVGTLLLTVSASAQSSEKPLPHRVFARSRADVDRLLARPYDADVPFGATGDRLWATSPQGWAFRDGVHLIDITHLDAFDLIVNGGGASYVVAQAEYRPSHVHMIGAPGTERRASASFTFTIDKVDNPLNEPFKPEKRWTCWSSGHREDWYAVDLGRPRRLTGLDLYFYDDQPTGGCAPPEAVRVELYRDAGWQEIPIQPFTPQPGKNRLTFATPQPQRASQVRLTFRNRSHNLYTGLYGFDPHFAEEESGAVQTPTNLQITGDKWITADDVLVVRLTAQNISAVSQPFFVRMESALSGTLHGYADECQVQGIPFYIRAAGFDGKTRDTAFLTDMAPGQTRAFTFACAVGKTAQEAEARLDKTLKPPNPLEKQISAYQGWFDTNTAYFTCSDPLVSKLYYHRWYNLKKNSLNPQAGALQHRTFAEGRWTADWYANVISYGAGHQIREARWLRDPSYAWGHLQTWTDNPRPDGIYPSHVTLKGQQGGQYTDWITATAWEVYLVHPNKPLLARIADTLARNAEAWQKVYGWNDSPLLVVDSHWWTGMEWQPSFFVFADYQTGGGDGRQKETALRRVDLTAYNFGNAQAAARIYSELGRAEDAHRLQALADRTRAAVLEQMWDADTHWFLSLRASDNAKAPVKEIIGLYPFTFDLPPAGKGYETAWETALSPRTFWTHWPLASTSQDCPAYAQDGWPLGPGGSGCMWNGPTWPHANSLVLTAMIHTLRHYAPCALTREKLLALFTSFTRAQYKGQDSRYPWTGEYYNGDTGEWKT
ncbi:MAG TPA: hypothetical protein VFB21_01335, partial [Chthonomonadaceae bacterium]|nr:hypothetical protein [Chthonomonadaceae bacterium]